MRDNEVHHDDGKTSMIDHSQSRLHMTNTPMPFASSATVSVPIAASDHDGSYGGEDVLFEFRFAGLGGVISDLF